MSLMQPVSMPLSVFLNGSSPKVSLSKLSSASLSLPSSISSVSLSLPSILKYHFVSNCIDGRIRERSGCRAEG